jgi:type VI secretion system protein ImpH
VATRIEQFHGQWLALEEESLTRLGEANNELGVNTIAGARVWDNQSKFRVRLGPLTFGEFMNFLPVGSAFAPLTKLVRLLAGEEFDFDVQLVLKAGEVPMLMTDATRLPMLGWTTWLKTREFVRDDSQVVLSARGA